MTSPGGEPHADRLVDEVAVDVGGGLALAFADDGFPVLITAPTRAIAQGREVRVCADESRPAARADMTSSLMARTTRKAASPVAHAGTGGAPELRAAPSGTPDPQRAARTPT